jgi:hypothetical protein
MRDAGLELFDGGPVCPTARNPEIGEAWKAGEWCEVAVGDLGAPVAGL